MVDSAAAKNAAKCLRKLSHALLPLVFQAIYEKMTPFTVASWRQHIENLKIRMAKL